MPHQSKGENRALQRPGPRGAVGGQQHFTHEMRVFAHDLGGISERTLFPSGLPVEDGHLFGAFIFEFGHRLGPGDAAQSLALQHLQFKMALGGG